MITLNYSDYSGYGMVHAIGVTVYVYGAVEGEAINPMFLHGYTGTLHFGTNRVLFQMD